MKMEVLRVVRPNFQGANSDYENGSTPRGEDMLALARTFYEAKR